MFLLHSAKICKNYFWYIDQLSDLPPQSSVEGLLLITLTSEAQIVSLAGHCKLREPEIMKHANNHHDWITKQF